MRKQWSSKAFVLLLTLIAITPSGCRARKAQATVEAEAASYLMKQLRLYNVEYPSVPLTNSIQLFLHSTNDVWGYPHWLEKSLRMFGKDAGFTNSFYEKHVFAPRDITNRYLRGELVLLNAQPYPNRNGRMERVLICKIPTGYQSTSLLEELVQLIFKEAGAEIPKATPMPAPPIGPILADQPQQYSLSDRVEMFFRRFAVAIGLPRGHWLTLLACCAMLLLVIAIFLFIWVGRRGKN